MGADARIPKFVAVIAVGLSLAACAGSSGHRGESDVSGHSRSRGYYKVGAPYKINGVWYHPRVDYAYDETGTASWYGEAFTLPVWLLLVQAINHATEHRAQVAAILTHQGVDPPSMDGWTYHETHSNADWSQLWAW